jgi:uncharacterized protein YndB with AHSA1/START domain
MSPKTQTQKDDTTVTLPSDTEILITRTFHAPPKVVFEAMTKPEHIRQWWGPHGFHLEVCEMDARPGGKWRFAYPPDKDGVVHGFHGEVREVVPGKRFVWTETYEPMPDSLHLNTATYEDLGDGRTRVTTRVKHASKQHRDGHVGAGMEGGMRQSYERLDAVLAKLA